MPALQTTAVTRVPRSPPDWPVLPHRSPHTSAAAERRVSAQRNANPSAGPLAQLIRHREIPSSPPLELQVAPPKSEPAHPRLGLLRPARCAPPEPRSGTPDAPAFPQILDCSPYPQGLRGGDLPPSSRHARSRRTFPPATAPWKSLLASASRRGAPAA